MNIMWLGCCCILLGLSTNSLASTSSSWYLATQRLPMSWNTTTVVAMPAIQRKDVPIIGPPLFMLILNFTVPAASVGAGPCNSLVIDIPILRRNASLPNPGPTHFFLWSSALPPQGTRSNLVQTAQESWIVPPLAFTTVTTNTTTIVNNGTANISVTTSNTTTTSNGGTNWTRTASIQYYRFARTPLLNISSLGGGNGSAAGNVTWTLGVFIEYNNYSLNRGVLDWVLANPNDGPPFLLEDAYANFLWPNVSLSGGQVTVKTAPFATPYYSSPANQTARTLAATIWVQCADSGGIVAPWPPMSSPPLPPAPAPTPTPTPTPPPSPLPPTLPLGPSAAPSPVPVPLPPSPTPSLLPTPPPSPNPSSSSSSSVSTTSTPFSSSSSSSTPTMVQPPVPMGIETLTPTPVTKTTTTSTSSTPPINGSEVVTPPGEEVGLSVAIFVLVGLLALAVLVIALILVFVGRNHCLRLSRRNYAEIVVDQMEDDAQSVALQTLANGDADVDGTGDATTDDAARKAAEVDAQVGAPRYADQPDEDEEEEGAGDDDDTGQIALDPDATLDQARQGAAQIMHGREPPPPRSTPNMSLVPLDDA